MPLLPLLSCCLAMLFFVLDDLDAPTHHLSGSIISFTGFNLGIHVTFDCQLHVLLSCVHDQARKDLVKSEGHLTHRSSYS